MVDTFEIYLIFFCDFSRKLSMGSARRNHRGRARGITSFLVKASREFGRLVLHWFFFSFSREREKSGKYFLELIRRHKQICRGVFFLLFYSFRDEPRQFLFYSYTTVIEPNKMSISPRFIYRIIMFTFRKYKTKTNVL